MKKLHFNFLALCLLTFTLQAQEQNCPFRYGEFSPESAVNFFGDKVNVRVEPSTSSALVAQKSIGSAVTVVEKSDATFTMGGYTANWYKVYFVEDQTYLSGYVYGGLLSMVTAELPRAEGKADLLLYGITSWSTEKDFMSTVRIVRDGQLLTTLDFPPISSGFFDAGVFGHGVCIAIDGNHGFKGIKNIIRISYTYEACGYENGEIFLLWDGANLTYLAKASQVTEAGVFSYTYELIFPDTEGGVPNTLKIIQEFIETESSGDIEKVTNHEITTKPFVWDGIKVTALPEEVRKVNNE